MVFAKASETGLLPTSLSIILLKGSSQKVARVADECSRHKMTSLMVFAQKNDKNGFSKRGEKSPLLVSNFPLDLCKWFEMDFWHAIILPMVILIDTNTNLKK